MAAVEQRPASKEIRALASRFKQGYRLERGKGGHWRVVDRRGNFVEHRGRPITFSGNPSPGTLRAIDEQFAEAHLYRGARARVTDESLDQRRAANRSRIAEQTKVRQVEANALRTRYREAFAAVGGIETPGFSADVGRVGALWLREHPSTNGDRRLKTPDLLVQSAHRMLNGAWVEPEYARIWIGVVEAVEHAPDPVGEWYTLVREARGLPSDTVQLRIPDGNEDDWPFRVELLPLDALLADEAYQRPVVWQFVRREAARFDPSLVGTIDVAQRSPSTFAILDGQQRSQIVRLVGKSTIWASIYVGLDLASEARFFLHKNRDRKIVHPYYTFRAMVTSGDDDAIAIEQTVLKHGYKLAIGAPTRERETNIAAIAAVQAAHAKGTLDVTLETLRRATFGLDHAQDALMIRGVARAYAERDSLDVTTVVHVLQEREPTLLLARARQIKRDEGVSGEEAVARSIFRDHDARVRKTKRAA